jgi:hypothetical protein
LIYHRKRAQSVIDYLISKGIDSRRLKAIGYGENMPRVLTEDVTRGIYTFKKGTTLTEEYIKSLPSVKKQAVANQLNRRTEFRVVSDDFVPEKAAPKPQEKLIAKTEPNPKPIPAKSDQQLATGTSQPATGASTGSAPVVKPATGASTGSAPVVKPATSASTGSAPKSPTRNPQPAAPNPQPVIPAYTVQVGAGNISLNKFNALEDVRKCTGKDGIVRIVSGAFKNRNEALQYVQKVKSLGFKDAWPVKVDENRKACFE